MPRRPSIFALVICLGVSCFEAHAAHQPRDFIVREFGAFGDSKTLDTAALNKAVDACAAAGGGRVLVPPGKYLTGTVRLRSNVTLELQAGAEIVGTLDLDHYEA